jgi:hypothetical protein
MLLMWTLGPVVFFARETVPMPASRSVLTMSKSSSWTARTFCWPTWATVHGPSQARAPAEAAASEGGLSGSRLDCGERERVDDVVH